MRIRDDLDRSVAIRLASYPVENFERFSDLILGVLLVDLHRHHHEEFREVDGSGSVFVHLVDHILVGWKWRQAQILNYFYYLTVRDFAEIKIVLYLRYIYLATKLKYDK